MPGTRTQPTTVSFLLVAPFRIRLRRTLGAPGSTNKNSWTIDTKNPRREYPGGEWWSYLLFAFGPKRIDGGLAFLVCVGSAVGLLLECQQHFRELAMSCGPLARVLRVVLHER